MPRIFIAVKLPEEVIQKITRISKFLQTQIPAETMKWVETENLHLTLKFLGEIPEQTLDVIQQALKQAAAGQAPFTLSVESLGMYPYTSQPRVIWLGIKDAKPVIALHDRLNEALADIELEKENSPFNPHLTMARVRQRTDHETIHQIGETLSQIQLDSPGEFEVSQVHLIESQLTPKGPIYTTRFSTTLSEV